MEDLIKWVFSGYSKCHYKAEMAVRVYDIIANYSQNPEKLNEVKKKYKKLFDFHENFILPDLKVLNVLEIIKLNNRFGVISKIEKSELKVQIKNENINLNDGNRIFFTSSLPQLTLSKILNEIKTKSTNKLHFKSKNFFIDPEKLNKDKLMSLIESSDIERIIFDLSKVQNFDLSIFDNLSDKIKIFVVKNCSNCKVLNFKEKIIDHTWDELERISVRKLSSALRQFQREERKFYRIIYRIHK
jgi:hypothetical protein